MPCHKETNSRVTRWFLSLQGFNFSVIHRPGQRHGNADALSHWDAFWASFSLLRTSGPGRGMCGITRGQVLEGCCIPLQALLQPNKMAAAHTTLPSRLHSSDRCRCLGHLIKGEGRRTKQNRRQRAAVL